jgi:dihydrodipicolinate synthase/N-acetylneuraminate lyase
MVALDRAILNGNAPAVERLDARVQEFLDGFQQFPVPVAIKAAVATRGIKAGPHASPLGAEMTARLERFQGWFREWLSVVQKECKDAQ